MKIAHVVISLDPALGGPPMVAARLAAAQAALGHEAHVVSYASPGAGAAVERSLAGIPHFEKVRRHAVEAGGPVERVLAPRAGREIAQVARGVDVLHLHGVWDPIVKAAAAAARQVGRPYALAPHGMLDPWSLGQSRLKKWKKRLALALGYRRMLNGAAFLHLLNADEEELIRPLGLTCPAEVIPNGIFIEEFDDLPPPGGFRAKRPELGGRPYVLFLGRLHAKKGLDYLADAFALLSQRNADARLVVAGPDDGAREPFDRQVRQLGIQDRVHVVGPLYGRDKLEALVDATCFCLPSRQEGFSMAVTEAMACGLPVVISRDCHFPEVAAAGAGEVVSLEPGRIAEALGRVLEDEGTGKRMGAAGRELVRSRYTWPKIAEQSAAAYAAR